MYLYIYTYIDLHLYMFIHIYVYIMIYVPLALLVACLLACLLARGLITLGPLCLCACLSPAQCHKCSSKGQHTAWQRRLAERRSSSPMRQASRRKRLRAMPGSPKPSDRTNRGFVEAELEVSSATAQGQCRCSFGSLDLSSPFSISVMQLTHLLQFCGMPRVST